MKLISLMRWKLDIGTPELDILNDVEIQEMHTNEKHSLDLNQLLEEAKTYKHDVETKYDVLRYSDNSFISIVVSNPYFKAEVFNIRKSNMFFDSILKFVDKKDYASALSLFNSNRFTKSVILNNSIKLVDGKLLYNDVVVEGDLPNRILTLYNKNKDYSALIKFMDRLFKNPGESIKSRLFSFLEHSDIKITNDGTFLAYKYVTSDFKDCFTGLIDNSVGTIVKMNREDCDDRDEVTCSSGLHVGSMEYVSMMLNTNKKVVLCEVDPSNVVSVPIDYNNTKMRVCEYKVIKEVEL